MKSRVSCVGLLAILMLVASPAALAGFYEVEDGGGWATPGASGSGWGASCSSSANAGGIHLSSVANYWASVDSYTDEGGEFFVNWSLDGNGEASYCDWDGSGASGTGAGGGSGYGLQTVDGLTLSSGGVPGSDWDNTDNPGIHGGTTEAAWFDAFSSVSAYSDSGAVASVGSSGNSASGHGYGSAHVWFSSP
jgi:hypothetical protein